MYTWCTPQGLSPGHCTDAHRLPCTAAVVAVLQAVLVLVLDTYAAPASLDGAETDTDCIRCGVLLSWG